MIALVTPAATNDRRRQVALQRILDLPLQDQVRLYLDLGEHLDAGLAPVPKIKAELAERHAAVAAIHEAAQLLGKPAGELPTMREFDAIKLTAWDSGRVKRAWGRWNLARDVAAGATPTPTPAQRALRSAIAGQRTRFVDPLESVQIWLRSAPRRRRKYDYDAWATAANDDVAEGEPRHLMSGGILDRLAISWSQAVSQASNESDSPDAAAVRKPKTGTWTKGSHDLITTTEIAAITGRTRNRVYELVRQPGFPNHVLTIGRVKGWLRQDVLAWQHGAPFPHHQENALQEQYYDSSQVARMLNVTPAALRQPNAAAPPAAGALSGDRYWSRADVEAWLETHGRRQVEPEGERLDRPRALGFSGALS